MQLTEKKINIKNHTLNHLIIELKEECQTVISLINQLELSNLTNNQKGDILAELLASTIHLNSHCDKDLQELISDELESVDYIDRI
ncbi:hypothetical protein WEU38_04685 [Cyanobacterium aponinum AL20118]|uniref:Uncharacterized protein n=1 Tax=Cyanobacterium aponinum AL20115 TaxID=3090662 RepID=A0AAF1C6M7_9CHRO|nr:hypothetical protein [Cyanobacterium aponinum]WPF89574.1 hypothetical protein SAY89_04700 [Cyanobacterium aponinum AL20115]